MATRASPNRPHEDRQQHLGRRGLREAQGDQAQRQRQDRQADLGHPEPVGGLTAVQHQERHHP
jgi:hypothetical protein